MTDLLVALVAQAMTLVAIHPDDAPEDVASNHHLDQERHGRSHRPKG